MCCDGVCFFVLYMQLPNGGSKYCVVPSYVGCDESRACCTALQASVNKMGFDIGKCNYTARLDGFSTRTPTASK